MKTVLVVDDMSMFREPIEAILKREGYTVHSAGNGVEALAVASREKPDLVLLDLGMPVMDGLTTLGHLRANPETADIAVIVLSAITDKAKIVQAAKLGIRGYMLKSQFSLRELLSRVREELTKPHADLGSPGERATVREVPIVPENAPPQPAPGEPLPLNGAPSPHVVVGLKSLKPLLSRSQIVERIESVNQLKALSPTVAAVLKLTSNPRCSTDDIAKAISQDQAIALTILRVANSSLYTRGDPVDSVHKAVVRIGMASIREAVMGIGVVDRFGSVAFDHDLSSSQFWEHSIAVATIAADLARREDPKAADASFTMGLLHDIGRVIYAELFPDEYLRVLVAARRLELPLEQVETRMLLLNHADVMERVLHAWHFPKDLINPIVFHHLSPGNVRSVAPHQVADTVRLGLANRLAHALLLGSSGNETIYPTHELCQTLRVDASTISEVERTAPGRIQDIKLALLANSHGALWSSRREQLRSQLGGTFAPLFLSSEPGTDACGIFCRALATASDRPNIAILHITHARERDALITQLQAAEQAAGVRGLPLITLAISEKLQPEELRNQRPCAFVQTPFAISRFASEVRSLVKAARAAA